MAVTKLPGTQIGTVGSTNLASGSVDATALASAAVTAGKIATAAIDSNTLFAAGVVDATALADNSVDAGALQAGAVTSGKIANNAVTSATINANAVTAAKLNADVAGSGLVLDGSTNALTISLAPTNPGLTLGTGDQLGVLLDGSTLQKGVNGISVNQSASFNFSSLTGTLSANLSANNFKITALADNPTNGTDAVNKNYVDSIASGLDPKQSCMVATVGALPGNTYNNGTSGVGATLTGSANGALGSIDGVSIASVGIRILVKNEATAANNGIYRVTTVGDASNPYVLTRATDFNSSSNITPGAFTFIEQGTTQADTGWVLANDGAITVGTTGLNFVQFSQTAAVNAGNGLTKVGNTISALLNSGATGNIVPSLDISSSGLAVKVDNASIGVDGASQLVVKANGIATAMIQSSAVGATQLASNAVVTSKISDGNVTAAKLNADVTVQLGALGTMATAAVSTGTETVTFANSATAADKDAALLVFLNGALLTPGASNDYVRNVTNNRTTGFTLQRSGTTGGCTYFFGG
jgi:hypothetical protein